MGAETMGAKKLLVIYRCPICGHDWSGIAGSPYPYESAHDPRPVAEFKAEAERVVTSLLQLLEQSPLS
jgi:hypothetical protein